MDKIRNINTNIGFDVYFNCVLVQNGLRNATLIQPADYHETVSNDPITAGKLKALKLAFPDLIQSITDGGETLISKHAYKETNIDTPDDMGKILGFPCIGDYTYTIDHPDEPKTSINVQVNLKPGGNDKSVQIIAYVCNDDRTFLESVEFAKNAEIILKADPVIGNIVESVVASKRTIVPPKYLIQTLLSKNQLSVSDQHETINYIWNLGLENATTYDYDFKNPVHRGILIGLLSVYDNNPIEPFYPLQYRKEAKLVDEITTKWDSALYSIFSSPTNGGRLRKTRKYRRSL